MGKKKNKKNIKSEQMLSEEYEKNLTPNLGEMGDWFEGHPFEHTWIGVDKRGYIFYASSGGPATIPKVVTDNYELQQELKDYFTNMLDFSTSEVIKVDKDYYLYDDIEEFEISFARKGIFYFDLVWGYHRFPGYPGYEEFSKHPYFLRKMISPLKPIHISNLNYQIQELMSLFVFDVDVNCNYIYVDRKSKTYKYNLFKNISRE